MADYTNTRSTMGDDQAFDAFIAGDLETLVEDGVTILASNAIRSNMKIKVVDLPNATSIGRDAFNGSANLKNLILRKTSPCYLQSNSTFTGTAIGNKNGAVFVPSSLVDTYKADPNWKNYIILPLDVYPTDDYSTIRDTWAQIEAAVTDKSYKTKYAIGDTKLVDLGTEGKIYMQIVAFDSDELTNGGAAAITWVAVQLINSKHSMNSTSTNANDYPASGMRTWLSSTVLPLFPSEIQTAMKEVKKTSWDYATTADLTSNEKLWIPSAREVFGSGTYYESSGPIYTSFLYGSTRIKMKPDSTSGNDWWLRSAHPNSSNYFYRVDYNGGPSNSNATNSFGVCLGFCTGKSPFVISESWSEIFAAEEDGSYSEKFSVGMSKFIIINNTTYTAEIVAMNADTLSDDSGTAKISWILKELYSTDHAMNSTSTNANGYPASEMRTWLSSTVLPLFPSEIQTAMKEVKKTSYDYTTSADLTSNEKLWIPSMREVFGGTDHETTGPIYSDIFTNEVSRTKMKPGSTSGANWWLRSARLNNSDNFRCVSYNGNSGNSIANGSRGVCLGFCT